MFGRKTILKGLLALGLAGAQAPLAPAQEPPLVPQPSAEELLRRLAEAEARIRNLEAERAEYPVSAGDAAGAVATKTLADDATKVLDTRLKKLEDSYKKDKDDAARKKADDAKKNPAVKVSGRIHLDNTNFLDDDAGIAAFENPLTGADPENRLAFRRLRLTFSGQVHDNMEYKLDFEFANPNSPEYRDAYIGFNNVLGNNTILFGNQKRPYGLDHWNSSTVNVFMERPLVIDAFNEEARRIGATLYGYAESENMTYQFGFYNLENTQLDGTYLSDPMQGSINGRMTWLPWYDEASDGRGYMHLAVAGMAAFPNGFADARDGSPNQAFFRARPELRTSSRWIDTRAIAAADQFDIGGLEAIVNLGPLSIVGEYLGNWVDRSDRGSATPRGDLFFSGYYVYAAYFLTGEHQPYDRKKAALKKIKPFENFFLVERLCGGTGSGWGAWQVAARYSHCDLSDGNVQGGVEDNFTFGLNWWFNQNSRFMLNYVVGEITDHRPVRGQTAGDFSGLAMRMAIDW